MYLSAESKWITSDGIFNVYVYNIYYMYAIKNEK